MPINVSLLCKECDYVTSVDRMVLRRRRATGQPNLCAHCGAELAKARPRPGATDSQKRSRSQEKRVAQREGGRRQPGSGATDGFEGDVRALGRFRGECKFTRAASYSLKLKDLVKLENQAGKGEIPGFDIEFQGSTPYRRYVVLPEWAYEQIMAEAGRRDDD